MNKLRAAMASGARTDVASRTQPTSRTVLRRIAAVLTSLALGAGLALVAVAAPASAHHNDIDGVGVCNPQTGEFDITWTVKNSEDRTETVTWSSNASVVAVGTVIGKKASVQFEHNGVAAGTYELSLKARWSNGQTQSNTGKVTVAGDCAVEPELIPVGGEPTFADSCGPDNEQLTVPEDSATVTWKTSTKVGTVTVTATAATGYAFEPGAKTTWEFTIDDAPCVIAVVGVPSFTDTCGPDNEKLTVPADTDRIDWSSVETDGKITVTATAKPGHVFQEGAKTSWEFATDDAPCVIALTGAPSFTDTCGPDNEKLTVPADTSTVDWNSVVAGSTATVTATAKTGSTFAEGTKDAWVYTIDDTPCPEAAKPATPAGTELASTGFAGTTIAIVAALTVAAGLGFLIAARARRKSA